MIKDAQLLVFDIRLKKLFIMRDNIHNDLSSTLKKKVRDIETCILYFQVLLYRHCQPLFPYEWGKNACCDVLQGKAYPKKRSLEFILLCIT